MNELNYELVMFDYFKDQYKRFIGTDLDDINNLQNTTKLEFEIFKEINSLLSSPKINQKLDINGEFRKISFKKYPFVILYRIDDEQHIIKLLTIYHSHMEITNITNELMNGKYNSTEVANALRKVNPQIQTEQLRKAFKEFGCDYDEAIREYLAEQARLASMSEIDKEIELFKMR